MPSSRPRYRDEIALRDHNTTYASVANIEEAQMILDEHVTSIHANQVFLREVLLKHGNAISNRWRKASQAKRALSIQRALPDIQIVLAGKDVKLDEQHCWSQGTEENIDTFSHTRRVSPCQRML
jgi:hypothetical protein